MDPFNFISDNNSLADMQMTGLQ